MNGKLTNRQRAFIEHYLTCWNASEAARRAGYKGRANSVGEQLMSNIDIKAEIERRVSELKMGTDEILARLSEQARGEHSQYLKEDGTVDIAKLVGDKKAHLVKRIKTTKSGDVIDVEFYDSQSALVHLGKAAGALTEKVDLTTGGKGIVIKEIIVELPKSQGDKA